MKKILLMLALPVMLLACNTRNSADASHKQIAQSCCDSKADAGATCTGDKSCSACKNCKYCKHCSKNGGTCGVCK